MASMRLWLIALDGASPAVTAYLATHPDDAALLSEPDSPSPRVPSPSTPRPSWVAQA